MSHISQNFKRCKPLFERLIALYAKMLQRSQNIKFIVNTPWFVFSLIIKSMALYSKKRKHSRITLFTSKTIKNIQSMIEIYSQCYLDNPQNMVYAGIFLKDLFSLIEIQTVFNMVFLLIFLITRLI